MGIKEVSILIGDWLNSKTEVTNKVAQRIFAVVAQEGTLRPFITFRVRKSEMITKDAYGFDVTLFLWMQTYKECVEFTDLISDLVNEENQFDYADSDIDYNDDMKLYTGIINLKTIQ